MNSRTFSYLIKISSTWKTQIIWKMCYNIFVWLTWYWWWYETPWRISFV